MVETAPWWILDYNQNVNEKWEIFVKIITFVLDKHAPLRNMRVKAGRPNWMRGEYESLNMHLKKLKESAVETGDPNDWETLKVQRNMPKLN